MLDYVNNCGPCTSQHLWYCMVDANCYDDFRIDKCDHPWRYQPQSCDEQLLNRSNACDFATRFSLEKDYIYERTLEFRPRTSCGFWLKGK